MNRTIKHDLLANVHVVVGTDGYVMECFDTEKRARDYLAEYEAKTPTTAGAAADLANKHGACFR